MPGVSVRATDVSPGDLLQASFAGLGSVSLDLSRNCRVITSSEHAWLSYFINMTLSAL
jgi:hypothetical protein